MLKAIRQVLPFLEPVHIRQAPILQRLWAVSLSGFLLTFLYFSLQVNGERGQLQELAEVQQTLFSCYSKLNEAVSLRSSLKDANTCILGLKNQIETDR